MDRFPHPRHACVLHKFPGLDVANRLTLAIRHCPRCYCLLCQVPASDCAFWDLHAFASNDAAWLDIRQALRVAHGTEAPQANANKRPRWSTTRTT